MRLYRIWKLGVICTALLAGTLLNLPSTQLQILQAASLDHRLTLTQLQSDQASLATLVNGKYQICSEPKPNDWRDGAGVCFIFAKVGNRVDGYYGYPNSDALICVRGMVNANRVIGQAFTISWEGDRWENIPKSSFYWDSEKRLALHQGKIIHNFDANKHEFDRVVFPNAVLNLEKFYRYREARMTSPEKLCDWNFK